MLRLLEPRSEKFRECQILLRTSGYPGVLPLVALTIDPERRTVWYTDGTPAGTSLPKLRTTAWNWYLIDMESECCFKGTESEVQEELGRPRVMSSLSVAPRQFSRSA